VNRALAILGVLVISPSTTDSFAQTPTYGWTISSSATDPFQNTGPMVGNTTYLWLVCADHVDPVQDGMLAAEFEIVTQPPAEHVATIPQNGFLNAGDTTTLLLAVEGCPSGPVVAANLVIGGCTIPDIGIAPSGTGTMGTVDCAENPSIWPIEWTGFNNAGNGDPRCVYYCIYCDPHFCCETYTSWNPCPPPPDCDECCSLQLDTVSWGSTKARYRD
jgi:hypothetical protein